MYLPIFKQGGDSNTITIVNGVRQRVKHLLDVPTQLKAQVVFDQSIFVKMAVDNVIREGGIGLLLTALMILLFLGNLRATVAVMLSIPLSTLAGFLLLNAAGNTINTMVLGGLALALSRLIDNSVIVLENIFRHMEMGEAPITASEHGGKEVDLAVLAATVSTSIVFFPVVLLTGVSKYLFTALALGVVLAMFASYVVAMTVIPLFCAKFIQLQRHDENQAEIESNPWEPSELLLDDSRARQAHEHKNASFFQRIVRGFNFHYHRLEHRYDRGVEYCLRRPVFGNCYGYSFRGAEPGAVSIVEFGVFSADGSGTVCDQHEGSAGNSTGVDGSVLCAGGKHYSPGGAAVGSEHDRIQHRRVSGSFGDLHHQHGDGQRFYSGQSEKRSQGRQLRVYGAGATSPAQRDSRCRDLLSDGRAGGLGGKPGQAGAVRYSGEHHAT